MRLKGGGGGIPLLIEWLSDLVGKHMNAELHQGPGS